MQHQFVERDPEMPSRIIEGEVILVPVKRRVSDLENGIFVLRDPVAFFIWTLLETRKTAKEIQEAVAAEFKVESKTAEKDVAEFLDQLKSTGAIREVG